MLEFNITRTEKESCTTFPTFMLQRVEPWLQRNNVEYKVYTGSQIPDNMPHGYVFKGHKSLRGVACIVSKLDSKQLHDTVERMLSMKLEEI